MQCPSQRMRTDGGRILVVENEPDIAEVVVAVLQDDGHTLVTATTLDAALASLQANTFDLVLVNGLSADREQAFAHAVTVRRAAGATPVVLFTGHRYDPETARAAGFADVISKPFDLSTFTERVRMHLGR